MTMQRKIGVLALAVAMSGMAACHPHGRAPRAAPVVQPDLDPAYGETALAIYQELAGRFPDSDAAARARAHVRRLENQFAEKTYKTGIFYLRRKAWDSAIIYFKDVIANYPTTQRAPDALLRLVDSYRAIGYKQELQETCEHLRRFYPKATGLDRTCPAAADSSPTSSTPSTP